MMSVAHALQRERIVPYNRESNYLGARQMAAQRGTILPSNVLHDEYLSSDRWRALGALYPAWAREILVYPEKGGKFKIGQDVVDKENGWIFPASYVPREAVGREKMALFVDPQAVTCERGKLIVHPNPEIHVVLIHPFIQESGRGGAMDRRTGVPLDIETDNITEKRYICRRNEAGVTPMVRFTYGSKVSEYHVFAKCIPEDCFGVSGITPF
jgi:hypothetical protein